MPHSNGKRHATSHISHARQQAVQASGDAVAAASDLASTAVEGVRNRVEAGKVKLQSILDDAIDGARERPIRVVLAAVGIGCLIGWFWKRR